MAAILRATHPATLRELSRNLEYVVPFERHRLLFEKDVADLWKNLPSANAPARVMFDKDSRSLTFFVFKPKEAKPSAGLSITVSRELDAVDMKFCKDYLRVFNSDLGLAPSFPVNNELWVTLQQSRFARAIGRFSPFPTEAFMRWLRVVESASSLRYEGSPYSACVLITKKMEWVKKSRSLKYFDFTSPLSMEDAILGEKWIRALLRDPLIGLVGLPIAGVVVGAVTFQDSPEKSLAFAPHGDMVPISSAIIPGTMAFVSSSQGDVYVLFPSGAAFVKSQGRWRYFNYSALTGLMSRLLPKEVSESLVRIILDISFERRGGLIVILRDEKNVGKVIPDHANNGRVNQSLRSFSRRLKITENSHRRIIRAGAGIDGAIILSKTGRVLDSACMIGEPSAADCAAVGKKGLQRFAGARTTAAWNASIFGVAIKISEDGPITIFENGDVILQLG
jgi:hypothetical protein